MKSSLLHFISVFGADIAASLAQAPMVPSKRGKRGQTARFKSSSETTKHSAGAPRVSLGEPTTNSAFFCRKMHSSYDRLQKENKLN